MGIGVATPGYDSASEVARGLWHARTAATLNANGFRNH